MNDVWFAYSMTSYSFRPFSKHFNNIWRIFAISYWTDFIQIATQDAAFVEEYFRREGV